MKLGRPHLIGSLIVLAASIVWNVWVFTQPSADPSGSAGRTPQEPPLIGGAGVPGAAPIDPSTIAPPPPLDLTAEPAWPRNPFAYGVAAPADLPGAPSQPVPVPAVPVVGVILYSEEGPRSAIIDGKLVGVGDRVQGGVVVSIARDAVVVRLASGEQVRLGLLAGGGRRGRSQ